MSTRLDVVTGKGGVGKSTVAAALAIRTARAGRRVLAIEMGAPAGLAGLLGTRPAEHGVAVEVEPRLWLAYYDGEAALAEYLHRHVPFTGALDRILSHPLYRAFVSAGPGVRELMAIGKVRDEMLGLATGRPSWDRIVLDAGASGHALQLLSMPAAAARTFQSGLAHREATRVAGSLADPSTTAVHVVALAEEMPLEEAAEVVERLRELELPMGRLIINRCRPAAPPGVAEAVNGLGAIEGPVARGLAVAARRALGWLRLQEEGVAGLEARTGLTALTLPSLDAGALGRDGIAQLVPSMEGLP